MTMFFGRRFLTRANPVATRLASKLFDQRVIPNQFRTAYLVEMIAPVLQRSGWCANRYRDFEQSGGCRLRVMQAAALQADCEEHKLETRPVFDIRPKLAKDATKASATLARPVDIYLIGWHPVFSPEKVDHRQPTQWEFFLLPSRALPHSQKTIGLARVRDIAEQQGGGAVSFSALAGAIESCRLRLRTETAIIANGTLLAREPHLASDVQLAVRQ